MLFSLNSERTFSNISKSTPEDVGPGVYDITPVMGKKTKMKAPFGTRSDRSIFPKPAVDAPSPCEYEPKPLKNSLAITSVFMSETNRKTFSSNSNPDPTKYSHIEGWGTLPQQHAPKKPLKILKTQKPVTGYVGQSDITCYITNEKGEWIPSKKKTKTSEDLGPGSYYNSNQNQRTVSSISIARGAQRNIFKMNESFPGPGSYTPKNNNSKIPIKISSITRNSGQNNTGGETNFLDLKEWVEPEYEGTAGFKSREIRKTFKDPEPTPAPTAYYRPPRQYVSSGNGFGFKAERNSLSALNNNPGPGSYESKTRWINKDKTLSIRNVPGRSTSTISELNKNSNEIPGPGKYNTSSSWVKENMHPSSVFESRALRGEGKVDDTPGAGAYNPRIIDHDHAVPALIHESRGNDQNAWVDKNKIENPSPDYYQKIDIKPGKGKTISSTTRDRPDRDQFPGPGAYNVLHASLKTKCYNSRVPKENDDE